MENNSDGEIVREDSALYKIRIINPATMQDTRNIAVVDIPKNSTLITITKPNVDHSMIRSNENIVEDNLSTKHNSIFDPLRCIKWDNQPHKKELKNRIERPISKKKKNKKNKFKQTVKNVKNLLSVKCLSNSLYNYKLNTDNRPGVIIEEVKNSDQTNQVNHLNATSINGNTSNENNNLPNTGPGMPIMINSEALNHMNLEQMAGPSFPISPPLNMNNINLEPGPLTYVSNQQFHMNEMNFQPRVETPLSSSQPLHMSNMNFDPRVEIPATSQSLHMNNIYFYECSTPIARLNNSTNSNRANAKKGFNEKEITDPLILAVVEEQYPDVSPITDRQLTVLRKAILFEIDQIPLGLFIPRFENSYVKNGVILVTCADSATTEWMKVTMPKLCIDPAVRLRAVPVNQLNKLYKASIQVLNEQSAVAVLNRFQKQNPDVNMASWKLYSEKPMKGKIPGVAFTIGIPESSVKVLRSKNFMLYHGMEQININMKSLPEA